MEKKRIWKFFEQNDRNQRSIEAITRRRKCWSEIETRKVSMGTSWRINGKAKLWLTSGSSCRCRKWRWPSSVAVCGVAGRRRRRAAGRRRRPAPDPHVVRDGVGVAPPPAAPMRKLTVDCRLLPRQSKHSFLFSFHFFYDSSGFLTYFPWLTLEPDDSPPPPQKKVVFLSLYLNSDQILFPLQ